MTTWKNYALVLLLQTSITLTLALQEVFSGKCPSRKVQTVKNFDEKKLSGTWYVLAQYDAPFDCGTKTYQWYGVGRYFEINVVQSLKDCGTYASQTEINQQLQTNAEGKYRFRGYPSYKWSDYYFVATDYKNYTVVWTCTETDEDINYQNLIIMSKKWDTTLDSLPLDDIFKKNPFEKGRLKYIQQYKICQKFCHTPLDYRNKTDYDENRKNDNTITLQRVMFHSMILICMTLIIR